jgi:outer membrane biosynthesis protein TonB
MPSLRTYALLTVFAFFVVQIAIACGDESGPVIAPEQKDSRTVILSVVVTNAGLVQEAKVVSGPIALQTAAISSVKGRKFKATSIDIGGATPADKSGRSLMLAVTFTGKQGTVPKVQQAMSAGVSSCLSVPTAVRLSPEAAEARLLNRVEPAYAADHVPGLVAIRVRIDKNGNVSKVEKIDGSDETFPAVSEAVKQWKYKPYLLNGEAVEVETIILAGPL